MGKDRDGGEPGSSAREPKVTRMVRLFREEQPSLLACGVQSRGGGYVRQEDPIKDRGRVSLMY